MPPFPLFTILIHIIQLILTFLNLNSIAASQNTTIFLARPNDKYSDLPRHPENVDSAEECVVCSRDRGEDDSPLACDKVRDIYSLLIRITIFSFQKSSLSFPHLSFFLTFSCSRSFSRLLTQLIMIPIFDTWILTTNVYASRSATTHTTSHVSPRP